MAIMDNEKILDVVIIGAGPAGVSCAVWLARLGFAPVLLEAAAQVGGLCLDHPFSDGWNATLPEMTGPEVARNLAHSLSLAQVDTRLSSPVSQIQFDSGRWKVFVQGDACPLLAHHLVLATGVRPRGLSQWNGGGALPDGIVAGPGTSIVQQDFTGKRVAVLGGGDNAFENALYALQHGATEVTIYARNVRAQQQFVRQFPAECVVHGSFDVDVQKRQVSGVEWDLILVFYGWEARLPNLPDDALQRTSHGFVAIDPHTTETSLPALYAIGEVAQRMHPCVVTALADGVTAAKVIQARLESTATEMLSDQRAW